MFTKLITVDIKMYVYFNSRLIKLILFRKHKYFKIYVDIY